MLGRTANILEALIDDFIETGEPISSGLLYDRHDFGIKPAMIRHELELLSDRGYLEQPHRSAGRVPTNRGYEFFAERAIACAGRENMDWTVNVFGGSRLENFADAISRRLGLVTAVAERKDVYKTGVDELLESLDWNEPEGVKLAINDFVNLENRLRSTNKKAFDFSPKIFIGRKSPITKSDNLSVIGCCFRSNNCTALMLTIGPKRMDYKKTVKIFQNLNERGRK